VTVEQLSRVEKYGLNVEEEEEEEEQQQQSLRSTPCSRLKMYILSMVFRLTGQIFARLFGAQRGLWTRPVQSEDRGQVLIFYPRAKL
jgi:hypothetical protein